MTEPYFMNAHLPTRAGICLTDPPAIVDLKREFRALADYEAGLTVFGAEAREELDRSRTRRRAIAAEIQSLRSLRTATMSL